MEKAFVLSVHSDKIASGREKIKREIGKQGKEGHSFSSR